jgi:Skp family chaperone for outer membrane proteins
MKKLIFIILLFFLNTSNSFADNVYFMDFGKVLNASKPGAEAQKKLKNKIEAETKRFNKLETDIKKSEADIISQKKALGADEYKKKVKNLRKRVADLQKDKTDTFKNIAKTRSDAKKALLKAVNPIVKKYMEDNNIRLIVDKKSVILGDKTLEITDQIIVILNKELPSLKIN